MRLITNPQRDERLLSTASASVQPSLQFSTLPESQASCQNPQSLLCPGLPAFPGGKGRPLLLYKPYL